MNLERIKHEIKYNSGPAIPYVRVGVSDAQELVRLAEAHKTLRGDLDSSQLALRLAHQENERLRKALEFYANADDYEDNIHTTYGYTCAIAFDEGKTAREALNNGEALHGNSRR